MQKVLPDFRPQPLPGAWLKGTPLPEPGFRFSETVRNLNCRIWQMVNRLAKLPRMLTDPLATLLLGGLESSKQIIGEISSLVNPCVVLDPSLGTGISLKLIKSEQVDFHPGWFHQVQQRLASFLLSSAGRPP